MTTLKFYTKNQEKIIKTAVESGEALPSISRRLSIQFNRKESAIYQKLRVLKKTIHVTNLAEIRAERVLQDTKPILKQEPAEIGIEVPHGMTFEGKPKRIMLHSDHFRIYF